MDQQQQTQQTEKIIVEMLEFLDSSSEEDNDPDTTTTDKCQAEVEHIEKDINDNLLPIKVKSKSQNDLKKIKKPTTTIAKELKKLKQEFPIWNTKEIATNNKNLVNLAKSPENPNEKSTEGGATDVSAPDYGNTDWYNKLETNCRRSSSNSYIQEIHRAIYQDTTGHPPSGSTEYYQAAQNYVLYGKHFLDFPENLQALMNDKNAHNNVGENSNLISNFGQCFYPKLNTITQNVIAPPTSTAASSAAYYQIYNSMQAQARPTLSNSPGNNSAAYGIFLGNKVTYVAATPTNPSLIYNQHSTTTTNFISNSLANAALATSPTILYTNPMLTTTTQQYLNTFFKDTQFLSTALTNSTQTATVASNASGVGLYERLLYAQMLQQQLYQTQQAAAVAAMFQHNQRAAAAAATLAAAARQSGSGNVATSSNRASPQHLATVPPTTSSNGNASSLNSCTRQARSSSPAELVRLKQQTSTTISATGNTENSKSSSD